MQTLFGVDAVNKAAQFLRQNVFPNERYFIRCHYLTARTFEACSNTPLEGTNSGFKRCELKVLSSISQAHAMKIITQQDQKRFIAKYHNATQHFLNHQLHVDGKL